MQSPTNSHLPREFHGGCLRRLRHSDLNAFQAYRGIPGLGRYQGWSPTSEADVGPGLESFPEFRAVRSGSMKARPPDRPYCHPCPVDFP